MNSQRTDQIHAFLSDYLGDDFKIESLAGDASFRRYHRIYKGDDSYLLMDAPPDKESVAEFIQVAQILSQKINVPDILHKDTQNGFLLLQDFGQTEFADLIKNDNLKDLSYQKALLTLKDIQDIDISCLDIDIYTDKKYQDEMDLFSDWFLPYIGQDIEPNFWQDFKACVIKDIQSQPKVFVHRDYHSRNLMQDKNSDRLGVIDFQDALIGAYTYDLISLVRDAYIDTDENWVNEQLQAFYEIIKPNVSLDEFITQVNIMGVQRHLKVLGIFIRLYQRDDKDRYLANIPKVMRDLFSELTYLKGNTDNDIYGKFLVFIESLLPKFYQKFDNK